MKFSAAKNLTSQWCLGAVRPTTRIRPRTPLVLLLIAVLGSGAAPVMAQHTPKSQDLIWRAGVRHERRDTRSPIVVYHTDATQLSTNDVTDQMLTGLTRTPGVYSLSSMPGPSNFFLHFLGNPNSDVIFLARRTFTHANGSPTPGLDVGNGGGQDSSASTTPEPSTLVLLATGFVALIGFVRRGRRPASGAATAPTLV